MTPEVRNLFAGSAGSAGNREVTSVLARGGKFRLEHIASHGEASPPDFWYDQQEDEWVVLLQGAATLAFEGDTRLELRAGDHLHLPAHLRHRVDKVSKDAVWLALHAPVLETPAESA